MSKNFVDENWVREQLDSAGVSDDVRSAVTSMLLNGWDGLEIEDDDKIENILEVFSTLAQGHGLRAEKTEEAWIPVERGFVSTGDIVRVKHDAFDGKTGLYHNGRVGKVVAVRSGDYVFRSTDGKSPEIDGARYHPDSLERRVS
jgi:hypothetical protein